MELRENKAKLDEYRKRAIALVKEMTLEEKVSQTIYEAPAIERLGVPAYNWWNEALHGVARAGTATVFPQAIAMAAMFDEDAMETVADAVSTEARAKYNAARAFGDCDIYKGLTFWSPNVNIFRDPRWGRGHETYGEDPYLTGRLGVRYIMGLQGHDENYLKVAACAKHFAVHSGPETDRHSFNALATDKDLYETYLPAFKACVQQGGVEAVMGAYNRLNGEPCCASTRLLDKILRQEWGFKGHITSDFGALIDFHEHHHVTQTAEESAALALQNGCDLNAGRIYEHLTQAVKDGLVSEEKLDAALIALFSTRMKLGMFEEWGKCPYDSIGYEVVDSVKMCALNEEIAKRCPVLLKNNGVLPLKPQKLQTIGVIGPNANSRRALMGNYEGTSSHAWTVLEGIQALAGDDVRVLYSEGCHLFKNRVQNLASEDDRDSEVKAVCAQSDVVIMVLGMDAGIEGEQGDAGNAFHGGDKPSLALPGRQQHILQIAVEIGKPVVLVTLVGSAIALDWAHTNVDAIIQGWYPGAQGGKALASLIFGQANFEGKLPITFYSEKTKLPDFSDYSMANRTYRFLQEEALYPFGYGLSYTKYVCKNVALSTKKIKENQDLTIYTTVENTGDMAGTCTVQVYVKAPQSDMPNGRLCGIAKVTLQPKACKQVEICICGDAFASVEADGTKVWRKGRYHIAVGDCQPDTRSANLTGRQVQWLEVTLE